MGGEKGKNREEGKRGNRLVFIVFRGRGGDWRGDSIGE